MLWPEKPEGAKTDGKPVKRLLQKCEGALKKKEDDFFQGKCYTKSCMYKKGYTNTDFTGRVGNGIHIGKKNNTKAENLRPFFKGQKAGSKKTECTGESCPQ